MANAPGIRFTESPEQILVSPADATLAAFAGTSTRGRIDKNQIITGWADYVEKYGGFSDSYDLALAVHDYLSNGGGSARIQRVAGAGAVQSSNLTVKGLDNATNTLQIRAADPGAWGDTLSVSFFRKQFTGGVGASSLAHVGGQLLPKPGGGGNAGSDAVKGYVLDSIRDVNLGDILSVDHPVTGAALHTHLVVADIDAGNRQIRFVDPGGAAGSIPAEAVLKTASRHSASTYATGQLANLGTTLAVKSTDGFSVGSTVSFILYSDYADDDLLASSRVVVRSAVVSKIIGQTLHFSAIAATADASAIPASTSAKTIVPAGVAGNDLTLTAAQGGTAGNGVVVTFVDDQAHVGEPSVAVAGRTVTVTLKAGAAQNTSDHIMNNINDSAAASALVTCTGGGVGNSVSGENGIGGTAYTTVGGALLRVISQEFDMVLKEEGNEVEGGRHTGLSMESNSINYIGKRLGGALNATFGSYVPADSNQSRRLILTDAAALDGLEAIPRPVEDVLLSGGVDGAAPTDTEMLGTASPRTGLHLFDESDDIDFACAPGFTNAFFQQGAVTYAEGRGDLLWLLDMPSDRLTAEDMGAYRTASLASDSSYAALYAPYGKVPDPRPTVPRGSILEVPPTPAMAGLIVRRVRTSGVHVSAANQSPAWVGVTINVSEAEHAALNDSGVNVIKIVRRSGLRLYGSKTLTQKIDGRRFTNVRRFLNFVKQSIGASLIPMTFSPANEELFSEIEHVVNGFLERQWRLGALYPQTSRRMAYQIKCDAETTSATDLANGLVNAVLQISPTTPAEQILFRINVSTGGIRVNEQ